VQDLLRTNKCIQNFVRRWLGQEAFCRPGGELYVNNKTNPFDMGF